MSEREIDHALVVRVQQGDKKAFDLLVLKYQLRVSKLVSRFLRNQSDVPDVVQEAFIGFLNSLPNYDGRRPLESYLFSICAYKLTDHLRREGRRPSVPLSAGSDSGGDWQLPGSARAASSIARSGERHGIEERAIVAALREQVARWRQRGDWTKLKCTELLFVRGWANKDVAAALGITEQQVANFKFDFLARLRSMIRRQGLSEDIFPELYQ